MFNSLRSRLIAVYLGLILFGFGGLTVWAGIQLVNAAYDDFGQNLQLQALQLAAQLVDPLEDGKSAEVTRLMRTSAENLTAQVALFASDNQLIDTTDGRTAELVALDQYSYQNDIAYAAVPIRYETRPLGAVQIAVPATTPQKTVRERITRLTIGFIVISGLGLGISLWVVATMTQPLSDLRETALAMAQGDLSKRVDNLSKDEIGEVGAAFNEMAERVEAMVREQRAFASNASHELRTPLTTIQLRTEALQDSLDDPELTAIYVSEIDGEAKRMGRLVDDLLLLSRLDAKRLMVGNEAIDAVRLLQLLQREYTPHINAKQIDFTLTLPDEAIVSVHLNHLRVVFSNVISNAIKYTQEGGRVAVTLRRQQDALQLRVSDNGRGIAPDDLPNIGKRFYRTDKAHSRATAGTGLGLALVRSIMALYEGEFTIDSAGLGKGTTVTIIWPIN